MMIRRWKAAVIVGAAALSMSACGDQAGPGGEDEVSQDGAVKETTGKGDRWDWRNDPARFRAELDYNWKNLPTEGYSQKTAWADTYWPTYEDSINSRWQGKDVLSPAEKYDQALNDWTPAEGFMDLAPYDPDTCEWDEEYYQGLGPAADYVSRNKGNWRARNGVDDDGDGLSDAEECGWGGEKDRDGVESWFGLCHAWVPAAILEDEPQGPVEHNGVTFEVADLKALLVMQYDRADAFMLGGRCNEKDVERDESGRLEQDQCRDVNAGAFHVIVTNFLGKQQRPIAEDKTYNYEVWNQPVVGYKISEQRELTVEEVKDMLGTGVAPEEDPMPQTGEEIAGTLRVANEATLEEISEGVGLRSDRAQAVVNARTENGPFESIEEIEAIYGVGPKSVERMLVYARQLGWAPEHPSKIYDYDENAESFVEVRMSIDYVTESSALKTPTGPTIDRYIRTDSYHYILELDGEGNITGGEWVGNSRTNHPDFLWLPTRSRGGNPHIDIETVRELIAKSRGEVPGENMTDFQNDELVAIPDNDPNGATSTITIERDGIIKGLTIDVDIEHSYRGDLLVQLRNKAADITVTVYDGYEAEERWEDNVKLTGEVVNGFESMAIAGEWELHVVDSARVDTGSIVSWGLHAELE